jgi:GNAT superfamily N-acetyltransferase
MIVRLATESDAEAACDVVRRSIRELCEEDHRNDPVTLEAWLEDKTVRRFQQLIRAESKHCVVALLADLVCGFGHIDHSGEIGLLYVAPEARFLGASTAMLRWLEEAARRSGLASIRLHSSLTARGFYAARGYREDGEPKPGFGITWQYPMVRRLEPRSED